jgi:UDP-N-acetylglucosamine:LPS N-acetylglucosamine transferase
MKVLILSVKAGTGHIRAAAAIEQAFKIEHPGVEVMNVEALEYTNAAFGKGYSNAYNRLATNLPSVWGMIYEQLEKKSAVSKTKRISTLFDRMNSARLLKLIKDYRPDRIICTHFFPAETFAAQRRKGKLHARLYVTLTDYDIHTMWIQNGVDHYFVASDEMEFALRAKGVGHAGVSIAGIPIMPVFSEKFPDRATMRERLGLDKKRPVVLVLSGGFGMTPLDETVDLLAREPAGAGQGWHPQTRLGVSPESPSVSHPQTSLGVPPGADSLVASAWRNMSSRQPPAHWTTAQSISTAPDKYSGIIPARAAQTTSNIRPSRSGRSCLPGSRR